MAKKNLALDKLTSGLQPDNEQWTEIKSISPLKGNVLLKLTV
jgi:hypothetical protein